MILLGNKLHFCAVHQQSCEVKELTRSCERPVLLWCRISICCWVSEQWELLQCIRMIFFAQTYLSLNGTIGMCTGLQFTKGVFNPKPKAPEEGEGVDSKAYILRYRQTNNSQFMGYWPCWVQMRGCLDFTFQCQLSDFHFLCLTKSAIFENISFRVHLLLPKLWVSS